MLLFPKPKINTDIMPTAKAVGIFICQNTLAGVIC